MKACNRGILYAIVFVSVFLLHCLSNSAFRRKRLSLARNPIAPQMLLSNKVVYFADDLAYGKSCVFNILHIVKNLLAATHISTLFFASHISRSANVWFPWV